MKRMWEFKQTTQPQTLDLYIYGDVEGSYYDWWRDRDVESETSADFFRKELGAHKDITQINIYINSYGGSVFEGTAIYSQLKRHTAYKTVYIDGFACSVASVIAMAGDKVVMPRNTMMMIHNVWSYSAGNAKDLRKLACDLDTIMAGNRQAYLEKAGDKLTEERLIEMLDAETWLTAEQCIELGLADEFAQQDADLSNAKQMLQKVNTTLAQHVEINKSLAARLREIATEPPQLKEPNEPKPAEQEPGQGIDLEQAKAVLNYLYLN